MEIEVNKELNLTAEENCLLNMHSFFNVMSILIGELQILSIEVDNFEILEPSISLSNKIKRSLSNTEEALASSINIEDSRKFIMYNIEKVIEKYPEIKDREDIRHSIDNINSVFDILMVRVREILARQQTPEKWEEYGIEELRNNFANVFAAVEKNSNGRYKIIYNIAAKEPKDYLVNFSIESENNKTIKLPPVFIDVMRDLIANARKYSNPGGTINIGLLNKQKELRFVVEDNGCGIPDEQLEKVVEFGYRATNVLDKKTMGGGFGLTKAFFITKQFGGRMWIKSELNKGTSITISIPEKD